MPGAVVPFTRGARSLAQASVPRDILPAVTARLSPAEHSVLEALEDCAIPFELVCERSGLELARAAVTLEWLSTLGLVARSGSGWERRAEGRR